jgi:tRNA(Ile2) C34 agmatinyltransferase TiaS
MADDAQAAITCPHCGGESEPELLAGDAGRLRGFKCPHCNLFVPEDRAEDADETALPDRS